MSTLLSTVALEQGTYVVAAVLYDENGNAITPKTLSWSLTDINGTIINSRDGIVVAAPATTNYIVLQGNDLAMLGTDIQKLGKIDVEYRLITLEGTYDSMIGSTLYEDLPAKGEVKFPLTDLVAIS